MADTVFTNDNIPDDVEVWTGQSKEFAPLDDEEIYQVHVDKAELRLNKFYNEQEEDPIKRGQKYNLSFEFTILNEGEFIGRKLWDNASLTLKPTTKRGTGAPTKLYKIVTKAMNIDLDWDSCASYAPEAKTLMRNLQETVVGKQLRVTIENRTNETTKKTNAKIINYMAIKQELSVPVREDAPHPADTGEAVDTTPPPAPKEKKKSAKAAQPKAAEEPAEVKTDDIPF